MSPSKNRAGEDAATLIPMIGDRLREARLAQNLSLTDIASRLDISVATLSRIETNKQNLDFGLFLLLAKTLKLSPHDLIGDDDHSGSRMDPMVAKIAALNPPERTKFWKNLSTMRRQSRSGSRRAEVRQAALQVEELLAQVDFLRDEIESFRKNLKR